MPLLKTINQDRVFPFIIDLIFQKSLVEALIEAASPEICSSRIISSGLLTTTLLMVYSPGKVKKLLGKH